MTDSLTIHPGDYVRVFIPGRQRLVPCRVEARTEQGCWQCRPLKKCSVDLYIVPSVQIIDKINPDCHPEKPENGQQTITLEHRTKLLKVIRDAQALIDFAWRARFASFYNDNKLALNALNEVRLCEHSINQHLKNLPPTEDFPENEQ